MNDSNKTRVEMLEQEAHTIYDKISNISSKKSWNFLTLYKEVYPSKEEVRSLYKNYVEITKDHYMIAFYKLIDILTRSNLNEFIKLCFNKYPDLLDEVFDMSFDDNFLYGINSLRLMLAKDGYVPNLETYDNLVDSDYESLFLFGLELCSIEKLRTQKEHKNVKARKIIYDRLGPSECLDKMLSDSRSEIRRRGVLIAPIYYDKLTDMGEEVNLQICNTLLKKGKNDLVILLIGNKNNKSTAFDSLLKFRIDEMEQ